MKSKVTDGATLIINQALSIGLAQVCKKAAKIWDFHDFLFTFLKSETYVSYYTDETLFSQAPGYVLQIFKEELDNKHIAYPKSSTILDTDIAHWMGYLIGQWNLNYEININNFNDTQYNWLYFGYDTLHTQSTGYVLDLFLSEAE